MRYLLVLLLVVAAEARVREALDIPIHTPPPPQMVMEIPTLDGMYWLGSDGLIYDENGEPLYR